MGTDSGKLVSGAIDACWAAVECWPALKDQFQRKFKTDDELSQLKLAGVGIGDIGDKAAIAHDLQPFEVVPGPTRAIIFPIAVRVRVWKRVDQYRATIDLLEEIIKAWYRSTDRTSGATFLELATCGPPQKVAAFGVDFVAIPQGEGPDASTLPVCYGNATAIFLAKNQA